MSRPRLKEIGPIAVAEREEGWGWIHHAYRYDEQRATLAPLPPAVPPRRPLGVLRESEIQMNMKKERRRHEKSGATSAVSLALPALITAAAGLGCVIPQNTSGPVQNAPKKVPVTAAPTNEISKEISDERARSKYFAEGYEYCDAKILARFWSESIGEAKAGMGRKIWWGIDPNGVMRAAREDAEQAGISVCTYEDGGFSYSDVELLAVEWGTDTYDAKHFVSKLLDDGQVARLRNELRAAQVRRGIPVSR